MRPPVSLWRENLKLGPVGILGMGVVSTCVCVWEGGGSGSTTGRT